jgi:uncharacterized membrane protein
MNRRDLPTAAVEYLGRVDDLLGGIDEEERLSLLADLADQLEELSESEIAERLGSPEEFAAEYRRSAGLESPSDRTRSYSTAATVISTLALPVGILVLFSFGGQLVFGPFVLAIEWIFARVSPVPLKIAWSLLAAALAGEIVYLVLDLYIAEADGFPAVLAGLVAAVLVALLFYRTSKDSAADRATG